MDVQPRQFGLVIAYLLPGFIALAGVAPWVPAVAEWLQPVGLGDGGLGPPVYAVLAAVAAGMIVGCVRWLIVDHLMAWTGVVPAVTTYDGLEHRLSALDYLVEGHYRFYQNYANTLVATLWAYLVNRLMRTSAILGWGTDLGVALLSLVLFAGARDSLSKFRTRAARVLGRVAEKGSTGEAMTNGIDHGAGKGSSPKATGAQGSPKPTTKAPTPAAKDGKPAK